MTRKSAEYLANHANGEEEKPHDPRFYVQTEYPSDRPLDARDLHDMARYSGTRAWVLGGAALIASILLVARQNKSDATQQKSKPATETSATKAATTVNAKTTYTLK